MKPFIKTSIRSSQKKQHGVVSISPQASTPFYPIYLQTKHIPILSYFISITCPNHQLNKRSNLAFKQKNKFRSTTSDLFYLLQQVTISKHPVPSSSQSPIHHLIYFTPLIFLPNTSSIYPSFDVYKTYNIIHPKIIINSSIILFIFNNHAIWFDPIAC